MSRRAAAHAFRNALFSAKPGRRGVPPEIGRFSARKPLMSTSLRNPTVEIEGKAPTAANAAASRSGENPTQLNNSVMVVHPVASPGNAGVCDHVPAKSAKAVLPVLPATMARCPRKEKLVRTGQTAPGPQVPPNCACIAGKTERQPEAPPTSEGGRDIRQPHLIPNGHGRRGAVRIKGSTPPTTH